jgi:molybdopterin biosynthesis enzyme MoaB
MSSLCQNLKHLAPQIMKSSAQTALKAAGSRSYATVKNDKFVTILEGEPSLYQA